MPVLKNPKHEAFAQARVKGLCADAAYKEAGYRANRANAARLNSNDDIQKRIAELSERAAEKVAERVAVNTQRLMDELECMGLYDPADIASQPMSGPEDIAKLPEHVRRAIIGWGWDKQGNFILKLAPKTTSIELMGKNLGSFRDKLEVTGKDGGAIITKETGGGRELARRIAAALQRDAARPARAG